MTAANADASLFVPVTACWICAGTNLTPVHELRFDLDIYRTQDPELTVYSGQRLALNRCDGCGFAQPAALPTLPRFFDRMYDTRWSDEWIASEYVSQYKDVIFEQVLEALDRRLRRSPRRLLDVGAHVGRFIRLAIARGWEAEGLELNPRTGAYAARMTGVPVHQGNVHTFDPGERRFDAIVLTDVLEHVPEPMTILRRVRALLAPDGWVAIKVPNGPVQHRKESLRARLVPGYRATLADNLVHVNHFSPGSLRVALHLAGFDSVSIQVGAPELSPGGGIKGLGGRVVRQALFVASRVTGGASSPLAFNLQAFARVAKRQ